MKILSEKWRGVVCCPKCNRVLEVEKEDLKPTDRCGPGNVVQCSGCKGFFRIEPINGTGGVGDAAVHVPACWFPAGRKR